VPKQVKPLSVDERFEKLSWEMFERLMAKNPHFATFIGLHEPYDKLLPHGGKKNIFESLGLLEEWLSRLREEIDFEALSDDHKIDWKVLEHAYELSKFRIYEHRIFETYPDAFEEIGGVFFIMFTRNYAPIEKRIEAIVSRLEKLPLFLEQFRTRFEKSRPVKLWTEIAIESCQRFPSLLQFIAKATEEMIPSELHKKLKKAVEELVPVVGQHLEWLKGLLPKTREDWALGPEKFEKLLKLRRLGMSSEEVYDLGINYLRSLKEERARLAKEIAPDRGIEEVLKLIEQKAPKSFEEALKVTREQMEAARKFIIDKKLVTVYEEDKLLVNETPDFLAPLIPFAALIAPAKFDSVQVGNYIVTRPKEIRGLQKNLNYPSLVNTAVHEGFPGHFLQMAISNRGSFVRVLGSLAGGTETIEGWAHYCEEMMMEHGFNRSPEVRFVQVNDAIWRAVRIIIDVKMSRGEMSFDEAVNKLIEETGMSREAAVAEVKRYTLTPGYQLSYLLGKHLLVELKKEVKQKMGDKFSEKFFHDTVVANGGLPIFLLRKAFDLKIARLKAG
jgi:uncharacterized protein (DUF885 family)